MIMIPPMRVLACFTFALALGFAVIPAEAKTQSSLRCQAGYAPSVASTCHMPAVQGTSAVGSGVCCSCPFGSYSSDWLTCRACTSGLVAQSGVDVGKWGSQCSCLPGFGDYDMTSQTCRRCPINTYSYNNQCLPCASGTFAAAQSTQCAAVKCPADSFLPPGGSTLSDCTRCKFGTSGQSCSTVIGCKCLAGYAAFDKTTGQCQQCATNAIAVFADMNKQDETATVCASCPIGTIASADRRTCVAPTTTTTTSTSITNKPASAATPFPTTPIPALACAVPLKMPADVCLNGYDTTFTVTNTDPTKTITISVPHTTGVWNMGPYAQNVDPIMVDSPNTLNLQQIVQYIANKNYVHIVDPNTNRVRFSLQFFQLGIHGPSDLSMALISPVYGASCASALTNDPGGCITVPQSDTPISITQMIADAFSVPAGIPFLNPDWDFTLQWKCSSQPLPLSTVACNGNSFHFIPLDLANGLASIYGVVNPGPSSSSSTSQHATYSQGDGTSKFGNKVIAFYDANGIQGVLAAPPATVATTGANMYFSPNSAEFSIIGTPCVNSDTVLCFPLLSQVVFFNEVMNSIAPGAVSAAGQVNYIGICVSS